MYGSNGAVLVVMGNINPASAAACHFHWLDPHTPPRLRATRVYVRLNFILRQSSEKLIRKPLFHAVFSVQPMSHNIY